MLKFLAGALSGVFAVYVWLAWAPATYSARVDRLQAFVSISPIGPYGPDTWLMDTALGYTFPTALIFGYPNNDELCRDIAGALNVPGTPQLTCLAEPKR